MRQGMLMPFLVATWGVGGRHEKGHLSRHGWMSYGGQERCPHTDIQQQQDNWIHIWMRRSVGLFVAPGISGSEIVLIGGCPL